jgi:ABC-2 type transport system ATP-binding protein
MLSVASLRKEFGPLVAVDNVSFTVEPGTIFGLIGPNGAGKTTTIRMILNILEPDAGEVFYRGEVFSDSVRNMLGYLPEERGLYRKSRVMDILLYFAGLKGMSPAVAREQGRLWLRRFQLEDSAPRKTQELSKGNQQKIQFIGAVLHNPEFVILDEPFAGLDPVNQILFKDVIQELKGRGKTIILSTHQMDQAERLSDALCLIDRGRVVLEGTMRDVKRQYGKNSLHVEFSGEGAFLQTLPGVVRAEVYENAAELELAQDTNVQATIGRINAGLELRKVELREPSLQSIFLQVVGGPPADDRKEIGT